jgi:uncharacterized membrane protein YphA (DoxX/SURF4 family)
MKFLRNFSRILVGLVFVFSGFAKGMDPVGFAFKIEDYFLAYGMQWATPLSIYLSITVCSIEFLLGMALLFNLRLKYLAWPLLAMMIFFTILTFFDAVYNPVPDCGCFGDVIKLTNWQTFFKNIVLIFFVAIIFSSRNQYTSFLSPKRDYLAIMLIAGVFTIMSLYQYRHLPYLDILGWKTGTDLISKNPGAAKVYVTYKNKVTGEEKEYLSPDYPWNDSTWLSQWEFVNQRVDESGIARDQRLVIYDLNGNDVTAAFISNPDYQFIAVAYDLSVTRKKAFSKLDKIFKAASGDGHSFIVLTGSLKDEIEHFRKGIDPDLEFLNADDTELKMMIRSNPGLILLKNGVILAKWHYNDFPEYREIKKEYIR